MRNIAIKVESLGKKYTIKHEKQESYKTFQDVLIGSGKKIITSLNPFSGHKEQDETTEEFWALKDVNFEINKGDKVGIIGRNGAGKSTLLKVLSRITEPTTGKIHINGRIASLLEVGTGFHPELTGRENIYLNGAILGMSRAEIKAKFDEIVAFAEVEKFLDTPVKRYSSGMYVRLAFSVAAHLEPEILVVDEVLAVGDVEFQKKCLGKMGEVSKEGRTILFVSHNMNAIEQLCNKSILLDKGQITSSSSDIRSIVKKYSIGGENGHLPTIWKNIDNQYSNPYFTPKQFWISDDNNDFLNNPLPNDKKKYINILFNVKELDKNLEVGVRLYSEEGELLLVTHQTDEKEANWPTINIGENLIRMEVPPRILNEYIYRIELVCSLYRKGWIIEPGKNDINIFLNIKGGASDSPYWVKRSSVFSPVIKWSQVEAEGKR